MDLPVVLVVDDEEVVREVAQAVLEGAGYRVVLACTGQEALDFFAAEGGQFSVVLLDRSMPLKSGDEVLEELQRVAPDVPVIMSSGYPCEADVLAPGISFLPKPYDAPTLLSEIKEAQVYRRTERAELCQ